MKKQFLIYTGLVAIIFTINYIRFFDSWTIAGRNRKLNKIRSAVDTVAIGEFRGIQDGSSCIPHDGDLVLFIAKQVFSRNETALKEALIDISQSPECNYQIYVCTSVLEYAERNLLKSSSVAICTEIEIYSHPLLNEYNCNLFSLQPIIAICTDGHLQYTSVIRKINRQSVISAIKQAVEK